MQRLWLIFAQSVTAALAVLFVISTLQPNWLSATTENDTSNLLSNISPAPSPVRQEAIASYATAANRALPAVVHIFTSKAVTQQQNPLLNDPLFRHFFGDRSAPDAEQRPSGLGSGVLVSEDGHILTNNHVIEAADEIEVALHDGSKHTAHVVGRDPETDLAVLRIQAKQKFAAIQFATTDSLRVGDVVLAIGNPFGVGQTVTMGIVSALGRSHLGINTFEHFIQTDAAINPGNSGGALVDSLGNLVGVNAAIYSRSGGSLGIGFAIPVSIVRDVLEQIVKNGSVTRGWIGVEVQEITPELAQSFSLPETGALISGVMREGPAAKAGIQPGDVLTAVDGKAVTNAQSMLERVASQVPGRRVKLSINRQGRVLHATVQIGRRPTADKQP